MNYVLLIFWGLVVFFFSCTTSFFHLLTQGALQFNLFHPDFSAFFELYPFSFTNTFLVIQKTGHSLSFLILAFLLHSCLRNVKNAIIFACLFGVLLELLQPFFGRDGRLVDVFVNGLGVAVFFCLYLLIQVREKYTYVNEEQQEI